MSDYIYANGELYHYGIPGMRWGIRRRSTAESRIGSKAQKKGWSEDVASVKKISKKQLNQMSNADLRRLNERDQLEITRRELKLKQNKGQRAAQNFIKTASTITAVVAAAGVYQKYGSDILDKIGTIVV